MVCFSGEHRLLNSTLGWWQKSLWASIRLLMASDVPCGLFVWIANKNNSFLLSGQGVASLGKEWGVVGIGAEGGKSICTQVCITIIMLWGCQVIVSSQQFWQMSRCHSSDDSQMFTGRGLEYNCTMKCCIYINTSITVSKNKKYIPKNQFILLCNVCIISVVFSSINLPS